MFLSNLHGWWSRNSATPKRQRRTGNAKPAQQRPKQFRPVLEALEDRVVPSTINWSNRGTANNDSDGFNGVFGPNAETARIAARGALDLWQRVITNFNYPGILGGV